MNWALLHPQGCVEGALCTGTSYKVFRNGTDLLLSCLLWARRFQTCQEMGAGNDLNGAERMIH